nr:nitrilase-related carbon-nitrogen hydrolase [Syntrophomonas wolfei]
MSCRAVDNQLFVAAASPARNLSASYQAWGHSLVVDPWGDILQEAGSGEEIIHARLDFSRLEQVRQELPLLRQRRKDLYRLDYKAPGNGIV